MPITSWNHFQGVNDPQIHASPDTVPCWYPAVELVEEAKAASMLGCQSRTM